MPNQEATTVGGKLANMFFFHFSLQEQLHSGQGEKMNLSALKRVSLVLSDSTAVLSM